MIVLLTSACSVSIVPQAEPTIDQVALQVTAISAASTIMAETLAAIPTATIPPSPTATITNTPVPTNTFIPLPAPGEAITATAGVVDPCVNKLLPATLTGNAIKIRIDNPTKWTINLSVYLQSGNPQGVCGYRGYTLEAGQSLVLTNLVEGCYTLWAWNPDPKNYFMVTNGTSCLDSSQNWTFDIVPSGSIKLRN